MKFTQLVFQLRKSTLFILLLFSISMTIRAVNFLFPESQKQVVTTSDSSSVTSYICTNIVQNTPVNIRQTFYEHEKKVYFFSQSDKDFISARHIWYNGNNIVKTHACDSNSTICISSVNRSTLSKGDWSVDLVSRKKLLNSKQFTVYKKPLL